MAQVIGNGSDLRRRGRWKWLAAASFALVMTPDVAIAQDAPVAVQISAQPLDAALLAFSRQANVDVVAPSSLTANRTAKPVRGSMTVDQALAQLLEGTGLTFNRTGARSFAIVPFARAVAESQEAENTAIVVTGTRIRGAPPTSPVVAVTQEDMRNAGQNDLGEVIRSLPQNFNGGMNPGVQGENGSSDFDIAGGAALNLRGLGQDATLTLLNGHRLAYGASAEGVNIAAIPVAAVERIEIVADGASAIYGSDAVGGVANVILRRDYKGASLSARYGRSTDGGYEQQQYNAAGGTVWDGGGLLLTYDFSKNSEITAVQRSYTRDLDPTTTLFPRITRHSALLAMNQRVADVVSLSFDAFYSQSRTRSISAYVPGEGYLYSGTLSRPKSEAFGFGPRAEFDLANGWKVSVLGFYGEDESRLNVLNYMVDAPPALSTTCYCNSAYSAEGNGEGPVFALPAGDVRLAIGGGYRANEMNFSGEYDSFEFDRFSRRQDTYYAFGEVFIPIIGPAQGAPFIRRLSVTAAARYEEYPGTDRLTTPKFGLIFEPTSEFALKASWGKAFKAPTLFQQYAAQEALLLRATGYGAAFPAGSTYLVINGGNPSLRAERATTWSATLEFQPARIDGLRASVSYFNIDYRNRVARPISSVSGVLTNPVFETLVTRNPSAAQLQAFIDGATGGLLNASGQPYNPAQVVAILEYRAVNVARQSIEGVDLAADYEFAVGGSSRLALSGAGTFLASKQELITGLPKTDLAGTIFNPPSVRARLGATFLRHTASLSAFVNYVGPVDDDRVEPNSRVGAVTTVDLTARWSTDYRRAALAGIEIAVSALNLLNEKPDPIRIFSLAALPYDSTNYSPIGRFVSVSVTKSW